MKNTRIIWFLIAFVIAISLFAGGYLLDMRLGGIGLAIVIYVIIRLLRIARKEREDRAISDQQGGREWKCPQCGFKNPSTTSLCETCKKYKLPNAP